MSGFVRCCSPAASIPLPAVSTFSSSVVAPRTRAATSSSAAWYAPRAAAAASCLCLGSHFSGSSRRRRGSSGRARPPAGAGGRAGRGAGWRWCVRARWSTCGRWSRLMNVPSSRRCAAVMAATAAACSGVGRTMPRCARALVMAPSSSSTGGTRMWSSMVPFSAHRPRPAPPTLPVRWLSHVA